ncbi:MAG: PEGA domain-containing protein [Desulfosudis oleivorans]|nr:PEGA domain-containing protein [Desulfosudis oleivorans]
MHYRHAAILAILLAVVCTALMAGASAAGMQASIGENIPLSGYSYGGPDGLSLHASHSNLPVNGVALDDITKRADQGLFTRVQVDSNNHWEYSPGAQENVGGRLDAGTYTVWVVNGPNDRSRLNGSRIYSMIPWSRWENPRSLSMQPAQSGAVQPHGAMDLRSVPVGASVVMGETYQGRTPLTVSDLPGTHDVIFSQFGY